MAKYLGIDYGSKRVGIACSDEAGVIAFPRGKFRNDEKLLRQLARVIAEERIDQVVVGDTRASGGAPNRITGEAEIFIEKLEKLSGKAVMRASELSSSIEASRYAPEGLGHDNAADAAVILQRYLDMHPGEIR